MICSKSYQPSIFTKASTDPSYLEKILAFGVPKESIFSLTPTNELDQAACNDVIFNLLFYIFRLSVNPTRQVDCFIEKDMIHLLVSAYQHFQTLDQRTQNDPETLSFMTAIQTALLEKIPNLIDLLLLKEQSIKNDYYKILLKLACAEKLKPGDSNLRLFNEYLHQLLNLQTDKFDEITKKMDNPYYLRLIDDIRELLEIKPLSTIYQESRWDYSDLLKLAALVDIYGGLFPSIYPKNEALFNEYLVKLITFCAEHHLTFPLLKMASPVWHQKSLSDFKFFKPSSHFADNKPDETNTSYKKFKMSS